MKREPTVDVDLRGFLNKLAELSTEYGIAIETDSACLYALGERKDQHPAGRTFLADGLGFNDKGPVPRYFCCPHAVLKKR